MPVFERPPLESLTPARERWTPLYLEHGRLEVDDSSVKWIGADRTIFRIPVATLSVLLLGPGTTATQAAMKACGESNTPVCWVGDEGLRFYSLSDSPTHNSDNARRQAEIWSVKRHRETVARAMFSRRFPGVDVAEKPIGELRTMEGLRVKGLYAELGTKHGVTWKGRRYDTSNWDVSDNLNKAVSAANAALYSLTLAVIWSTGYLPQLGFIHSSGPLALVYDFADLYKPETSLPAAFQAIALKADAGNKEVLTLLKLRIEEAGILRRLPKDLEALIA